MASIYVEIREGLKMNENNHSTDRAANGADIATVFADPKFLASVYAVTGKTSPEPINDIDAAKITDLPLSGSGIDDLKGLEYFVRLKILHCADVKLTVLPALPAELGIHDYGNDQLAESPAPPVELRILDCDNDQLPEPLVLPVELRILDCGSNQCI